MSNSKYRHRCTAAFIIVFLASIAMVGMGLPASSMKVQSMATVKGTVMDSNGAVIVMPKPSIIFERNNNLKRVVGNENGDYEITLPPGVYKVTTEIAGFYPLRRGEFRVPPGSSTMINLIPQPLYLVRGTTIGTSKSVDTPAPPPKYDEFRVQNSSPQAVSLLIQFDKKRAVHGKFQYDRAVLSYDVLTIYAEKLCFNKKDLLVKASGGRVVVEDGRQRIQVKEALVSFKGGEPVVSLTR